MFVVMVVFHVLVCIALVLVVLLQASKGEGLAGSAFGGGGGLGGAVFGGRGAASFLSKSTSVLAVVFMLNCGILAYMSSSASRRGTTTETPTSTVTQQAQREMEQAMQQQQAQQQAQPGDTSAPVQLIPPEDMTPAPSDTSGQ